MAAGVLEDTEIISFSLPSFRFMTQAKFLELHPRFLFETGSHIRSWWEGSVRGHRPGRRAAEVGLRTTLVRYH